MPTATQVVRWVRRSVTEISVLRKGGPEPHDPEEAPEEIQEKMGTRNRHGWSTGRTEFTGQAETVSEPLLHIPNLTACFLHRRCFSLLQLHCWQLRVWTMLAPSPRPTEQRDFYFLQQNQQLPCQWCSGEQMECHKVVTLKDGVDLLKAKATMCCWHEVDGHFNGSWDFDLNGHKMLHVDSNTRKWTEVDPGSSSMKE
ncbi:hypothetical protein A6R68_00970, partial [Neotoma lepida]